MNEYNCKDCEKNEHCLTKKGSHKNCFVQKKTQQMTTDNDTTVTQGIWTHIGSAWSQQWMCSRCNKIAYHPSCGKRDKRILKPCPYKYCPNCGVPMKSNANYTDETRALDILLDVLKQSGLEFRLKTPDEEGGFFYIENGERKKLTENIFVEQTIKTDERRGNENE